MTETYKTGKWNLDDLFPSLDSKELKDAFEQLEADVSKYESWNGKLDPDMDVEEFMALIDASEKTIRIANRIYQYAGLLFAQDTQNQDYQTFMARVQQTMAGLQNRTLFFDLWWKSLETDQTKRFKEVAGEYDYHLDKTRNFKPFTLSEKEEKLINIKNVTGAMAIQRLYDSITNGYTYKITVDGEEKELTRGETMQLVYSTDPDKRAMAYQEIYRVFGEDGPILGQMYQALAQDWANENIDLRGFEKPISVRNLNNDVPDEVVDVLLNVSIKNSNIFQRFFKLKAQWMKQDKIRRYDIYAPVADGADKKYTYDQAVEMVLDSFEEFDPRMSKLAKQIIDEDHIDSEVRKGKDSGAFCSSGDPDHTPFVLLSFNGRASDIGTLAHELGHGIHALLAEDHNVFNFHSSLPLAETASTFSEMVLTDYLLEHEEDESVKRDILFAQIDGAYGTIMRQVFFAVFERDAHKLTKEGASVDDLCNAYMENLKTQFGDSLELSEEFKWEWVSIPHIYAVPFYVYAYSFGLLLVLSLYKQFKNEGKSFIPRYLDILKAGGSMAPADILDRAGVNIRTAEFWQGGYDVLSEMVDKLEQIPVTE